MDHDALTGELPAPFGAVCCHCERWSAAAIPCRYIERASGPGVTLYACPDCVLIVGVGPVADDVLHGMTENGI
ncbi:hypothetical protein [Streptomyces acidiscabies]|uniref:hypothetical protein n=1 Tax=Streptomyces acidiscabies TaxID=42234 RepID=UPI0038F6DE11